MRQLITFTKKEFTEQLRSGRLLILTIIFTLFGLMNPAITKITPWMMELLAEDLEKTGISFTNIQVDALTSWGQFFKNIPIALIIFLVMFGGILSLEYQKGTLINIITKGLSRFKIIISKTVAISVLWTLGYVLSYGITYGYNAYYWDNSIAKNVVFAAFIFYIFGLWLISIIPLASTIFTSTSSIILSVGGAFLTVYLLGLLPALKEYSPIHLMDSSTLLTGASTLNQYIVAIMVTVFLIGINIISSIALFNRKNI